MVTVPMVLMVLSGTDGAGGADGAEAACAGWTKRGNDSGFVMMPIMTTISMLILMHLLCRHHLHGNLT
jgi:hypothetical protein